jgi:hypothetical protein
LEEDDVKGFIRLLGLRGIQRVDDAAHDQVTFYLQKFDGTVREYLLDVSAVVSKTHQRFYLHLLAWKVVYEGRKP